MAHEAVTKELLSQLNHLGNEIHSRRVQTFFHRQPEAQREQFLAYREELTIMTKRLAKQNLDPLTGKLERLFVQLQKQIDLMHQSVSDLRKADRIIEDFASVLDLLSRVISMKKHVTEPTG